MQYHKQTKTLYISYFYNKELLYIENAEIIIFKKGLTISIFNKKVDNLPQSLIKIYFNDEFDQKVDKLPKNLTHLTFGSYFNQEVNKLPKNLTHLILGFGYGYGVNKNLTKLPKNLINLTTDCSLFLNEYAYKYYNENNIKIHKNIKEITLCCADKLIDNLPINIEKINIKKFFNRKIENLPLSIKEIVIEDKKYKEFIKKPFGCIITIEKLS
jgi:hypothetical protein